MSKGFRRTGVGEEDRAFDRLFEERAVDGEVADLGVVGAAGARRRGDGLGRVLGRGADAEAGGDRGVDRHPFGQRDDRLLGLGGRRRAGLSRRFAVDVEVEVEPVGELARSVERRAAAIGSKAQFVAALRAARCGRGRSRPAPAAARSGGDAEGSGAAAGGRQGQVGLAWSAAGWLRRPSIWRGRRRARPR